MTSGMRVLTKGTSRQMIPCDHEEADRLLVHVIDSLNAGCSTCLVRTVDTDVCCHYPRWEVSSFTYIKSFCEDLGGLWYRKKLCIFGYQFHQSCSGRAKIFGLTSISAVILPQLSLVLLH